MAMTDMYLQSQVHHGGETCQCFLKWHDFVVCQTLTAHEYNISITLSIQQLFVIVFGT
jgi:hypothetical protein